MKPKVPKAIKEGHKNLLCDLENIMKQNSDLEKITKPLHKAMTIHFKDEEKQALPPLGLLLNLSKGNWQMNTEEAIKIADSLTVNLTRLEKEHKNIENALRKLEKAVKETNNKDFSINQFIRNLKVHIDIEDQVLYPTIILVGNYLKKMQ